MIRFTMDDVLGLDRAVIERVEIEDARKRAADVIADRDYLRSEVERLKLEMNYQHRERSARERELAVVRQANKALLARVDRAEVEHYEAIGQRQAVQEMHDANARVYNSARQEIAQLRHRIDEIDEGRALAEKEAEQLRAQIAEIGAALDEQDIAGGDAPHRAVDPPSRIHLTTQHVRELNEQLAAQHDLLVALQAALQQRASVKPTTPAIAEFHILAAGSPEQMVDLIRRMTPPGARPSVVWHIPKGAIDAQQVREAAPHDGSRGAQPAVREEAENPDQGREGVCCGGPGDGEVQGQGGQEEVSQFITAVSRLPRRALEELP